MGAASKGEVAMPEIKQGKAARAILLSGADRNHHGHQEDPDAVARELAAFMKAATRSLEICIFDFRLGDQPAKIVTDAVTACAENGVEIRIAYSRPKPTKGVSEHAADAEEFLFTHGAHPFNTGTGGFLQALNKAAGGKLAIEEINPGSHLMHDKYVIRDRQALWTGSANFTNDAWTFQENNVLVLESAELCETYYLTDFEELWRQGTISSTGKNDSGTVKIDGVEVFVAFAPGDGKQIDDRIAAAIAGARNRVVIASMVISSENVLTALTGKIDAGVEVRGVYDKTQMAGVVRQWSNGRSGSAKAEMFGEVQHRLVGKSSTPYTASGRHDFMHNKIVVIDDTVITGSFNFSQNATGNAENILVLADADLARIYADYIDGIAKTYGAADRAQ
jgi:phosphatidylserine/phosphatidylglycerophosphate/cardiolipin synthase-like enzyme